jgi:hypothetical protein
MAIREDAMRTAILIGSAAFAAFLSAAGIQAQTTATESQERVARLVVYGNDPCPRGTGDEIVICARKPEAERYRIPETLRDEAVTPSPKSESWASRAQSLEYVGNGGIQSCSTVGPGGSTGCWNQLLRQWRQDRRAAAAARARQP